MDSLIDLFEGFEQPEIIGVGWTEDDEEMQLSLNKIPIEALYPENARWVGSGVIKLIFKLRFY